MRAKPDWFHGGGQAPLAAQGSDRSGGGVKGRTARSVLSCITVKRQHVAQPRVEARSNGINSCVGCSFVLCVCLFIVQYDVPIK
jgi:hypothetical protein